MNLKKICWIAAILAVVENVSAGTPKVISDLEEVKKYYKDSYSRGWYINFIYRYCLYVLEYSSCFIINVSSMRKGLVRSGTIFFNLKSHFSTTGEYFSMLPSIFLGESICLSQFVGRIEQYALVVEIRHVSKVEKIYRPYGLFIRG